MNTANVVSSQDELRGELRRLTERSRYLRTLRSTIGALLVVAAAAVVIAMLVMPVLQIQGTSMSETLNDQDVVLALRGGPYKTGDVLAFYCNNNLLVKRIVATSGQWVNIADDGTVYVDDVCLSEPYVHQKAKGDCDIRLPYQVPEGRLFVMSDHRSSSIDSRNSAVGCVSQEMVVGRLLLRVWPLTDLGFVN